MPKSLALNTDLECDICRVILRSTKNLRPDDTKRIIIIFRAQFNQKSNVASVLKSSFLLLKKCNTLKLITANQQKKNTVFGVT